MQELSLTTNHKSLEDLCCILAVWLSDHFKHYLWLQSLSLSTVLFHVSLSKKSIYLPSLGPCGQLAVAGSLNYKCSGNHSFKSNLFPGMDRLAKGRCLPVPQQFQYKLTQSFFHCFHLILLEWNTFSLSSESCEAWCKRLPDIFIHNFWSDSVFLALHRRYQLKF